MVTDAEQLTPRPLTNQIIGNKESSSLQDPDMDKSPELQ